MKRILISTISFSVGLFLFSSCNKNDQTNNSSTSALIMQGSWSVARYADNGNDETDHYKNYRFTFSDAGIIHVTNDAADMNGSWGTTTEDNKNRLIISFGAAPFSELTDDWHVLQATDSAIMLEDASGGNGGTDTLIFKKI